MNDETADVNTAIKYAKYGIPTVPVKYGQKHPSIKGWNELKILDSSSIQDLWNKYGESCNNISMVVPDDMLVLDIDKHNGDGEKNLADWEEKNGKINRDTVAVRTGGGGFHFYYYIPEEYRNINTKCNIEQIDILRSGHAVIMPPSVNSNGGDYTWIPGHSIYEKDIAEVDENLLKLITYQNPESNVSTTKKRYGFTSRSSRNPVVVEGYHWDEKSVIREGKRHNMLLGYCLKLCKTTSTKEEMMVRINETFNPHCIDGALDDKEINDIVRYVLANARKPTIPETSELVKKLIELNVIENYDLNDISAGKLFAEMFGCVARFNESNEVWMVYQDIDGLWHEDSSCVRVSLMAQNLVNALLRYCENFKDSDMPIHKSFIARCKKLTTTSQRDHIIKDAKSYCLVRSEDFDTDKYLLPCKNGVYDLSTCMFTSHAPENLVTRSVAAEYDEQAKSTLWTNTICKTMEGNSEKIEFLQKLAGYCLCGDTRLEKMFIIFGETSRNGKSTFIDTLSRLLGNFSLNVSFDTISVGKRGKGNASSDLARLKGCRLAICSEPPEGMLLDAALIKQMTGNDPIVARPLYSSEIEYFPQFHLVMHTNYLPRISDPLIFKSGRIVIIPFTHRFTGDEDDKSLKEKLSSESELSGILNWCIEGWKKYKKDGLDIPACIQDATKEYEESSDRFLEFWSSCFELCETSAIKLKDAYALFRIWCELEGIKNPRKKEDLKRWLQRKGMFTERYQNGVEDITSLIIGYKLGEGAPGGVRVEEIYIRK